MSPTTTMINLEYDGRLIFAIHVPAWSTQHELVINSSSSWIKYPSPKGWDWLKLPLNEDFEIIGLSTPQGLKTAKGVLLNNGNEIFGTVIRSHITTNAEKYNVMHEETNVYLVVEMFF